MKVPRWAWAALAGFVLLSRFWDLASRPLHADEANNAFFLMKLLRWNLFSYDPERFHGPTLVYLEAFPVWLGALVSSAADWPARVTAAATPWLLRLGPAVTGAALVVGVGATLGGPMSWAAFLAALLAGVSPNFTFFSRVFIHEMLFIALSWAYFESLRRHLFEGGAKWRTAAFVSAALLAATKETAVITLLIVSASGAAALRLRVDEPDLPQRPTQPLGMLFLSIGAAVATWVLLYTGFLTRLHELKNSLLFISPWTREAVVTEHAKSVFYYLEHVILRYEPAMVAAAVVGVWRVVRRPTRLGAWLLLWTAGMTLIYSLIPYKTPWLALNMILPGVLLAAHGLSDWLSSLMAMRDTRRATLVASVFAVLVGVTVWNNARLQLADAEGRMHPQLYAATRRDVFKILNGVRAAAVQAGGTEKLTLRIGCRNPWPLPYYLRGYEGARWGSWAAFETADADVVIVDAEDTEMLKEVLRDNYTITMHRLTNEITVALLINARLHG